MPGDDPAQFVAMSGKGFRWFHVQRQQQIDALSAQFTITYTCFLGSVSGYSTQEGTFPTSVIPSNTVLCTLAGYGDTIVRAAYDGEYDRTNLPKELIMS